uniref:Uncharacterized protein n=1 Tax=Oryza punctata TaxID=4537 RepID=A0A0E0MDW8_ORYPU
MKEKSWPLTNGSHSPRESEGGALGMCKEDAMVAWPTGGRRGAYTSRRSFLNAQRGGRPPLPTPSQPPLASAQWPRWEAGMVRRIARRVERVMER